MIEKPPKSQIVLSGKTLGWQEYNGKIESTKALFEAMKTVRNNLFHGGKNGYPDEGRDAQLIEACIHLMTKALENHDGVRNAFERKY